MRRSVRGSTDVVDEEVHPVIVNEEKVTEYVDQVYKYKNRSFLRKRERLYRTVIFVYLDCYRPW